MNEEKLLRLPEVSALVGLKRSALYSLVKDKLFPQPVPLGDRAIAFVESEVRAWIKERIAQRDQRMAA